MLGKIKNRMPKEYWIVLLEYIITIMIFLIFFTYDSKELSSGYLEQGQKKTSEAVGLEMPYMLTYGPYQDVREEKYIVILRYKATDEGNKIQVYTDTDATVLSERMLHKDEKKQFQIISGSSVALQVLTYYGGKGTLVIKGVSIVPVWLLIWCVFMGGVCLSLLVVPQKKLKWLIPSANIFQMALCGHVISYCDNVNLSVGKSFILTILLLVNICIFYLNKFERLGIKEVIFVASLITCWMTEWLNVIRFEFGYMVLILSGAICVLFLWIIYNSKHNKIAYSGMITLTWFFLIYSVAQNMYFIYFRDFFTIKIIYLFTTAIEAASSIVELFTKDIILYFLLGILYTIVLIVGSIGFKQYKKTRKVY